MPAYLCHGFRWHRREIRYFVILKDVEDAAPEWIVAPKSAEAILETFYDEFDFVPPCANSRAASSLNAYNTQTSGSSSDMYKVSIESSSDEERRGRLGSDLLKKRSLSASRQRSMSTARLRKPSKRPETLPVPPRPMQAPPPLFSPMPPESERTGPFNGWSRVKLLEEYDPSDEAIMNGPWAYVSDYQVRVDGSVSLLEQMQSYDQKMKAEKIKAMSGPSDETSRKVNTVGNKNAGWLEKLRDQLQKEEPIKWYMVICGDEERAFPLGDKGDDIYGGKKHEIPEEDDLEFRLPEFDNYRYNRKSAFVQPLRLRSKEESPPPLTPPIPPQLQGGFPVRPQTRARPQTQPQPQLPQIGQSSRNKPPALPDKDRSRYTPPPDPLENLREIGNQKMSMQLDSKPRTRKSTLGLRKFFSKKQYDNMI
ncbi:hypothetical protein TruAng_010216 [Truncatella angustata]|nr:hypothetical protein TruAng_010216 [Truncatella angustata]